MKAKYISEIIGEDFHNWTNRKVLLTAHTGAGKTHFIVRKVIPYVYSRRNCRNTGKVLILSNRTLLRKQYEKAVLNSVDSYSEYSGCCTFMTYQELANKVASMVEVKSLFTDYDAIICDEAHYFYADSDFAPEAYKLLYVVLEAGYYKTMIFLSATMDEVKPFIIKAWNDIRSNYRISSDFMNQSDTHSRIDSNSILIIDHLVEPDYSRLKCFRVGDLKSLATILANDFYKSLVFIDNKDMAGQLQTFFKEEGLKSESIAVISSDNISGKLKSEIVDKMVSDRKLGVKVLITTSVLDNGVSIEDEDVRNVCIITNSKLSFLQMIGRVRFIEGVDSIRLIFIDRKATDFERYVSRYNRRVEEIEGMLPQIERAEVMGLSRRLDFLMKGWKVEDTDISRLYRCLFIPCKGNPSYLRVNTLFKDVHVVDERAQISFLLNRAAVEKTKTSYFEVLKLQDAANKSVEKAIRIQMGWIGKEAEPLISLVPVSEKERKDKLSNRLLEVNGFTNEELVEFKVRILAEEDLRKMYPEIRFRNGDNGFSTDKLKYILDDLGLILQQKTVNNRQEYTILRARK